MRALRFGLLFLLWASACLGADQWTRVQSGNFTLVGNAKEKTIRRVGAKLEQFRAAFGAVTNESATASPIPTVVVVFKNDGAFEPFKPVHEGKTTAAAGYFQAGEDVNYIALSPDSGGATSPYHVIFHEYVHQIIHTQAGDIPAWLNEGLAEYYSTFEVEDSTRIWVGKLISDHVLLLRDSFLPVSALVRADRESFLTDDARQRGVLYAESWVLTHYLLLADQQRYRKRLANYLSSAESASEDPEQDFTKAFGVSPEVIENGLKDYIRQASIPVHVYTLLEKLDYEQQMTSSVMSESEVAYYLGDALLHSQRMNEAESYLRKAISLDPNNADAHASFGMLRLRQDRIPEARAKLEKAVADPSAKPIAHYYYALALMREQTEGISQETNQTALTHVKKALELMPQYAPAYDLLAFVNLASDQEIDESINLVRTGIRLAPKRMGSVLTLARLQLRKRDYEGARQSLGLILSRKTDAQLKRLASDLLVDVDAAEARARQFEEERRRIEAEARAKAEAPAQELQRGPKPEAQRDEPVPPPGASDFPAPGVEETVSERPLCYPDFADVRGLQRISGILTNLQPAGKGLAFTVAAGNRGLVFFAPDRNVPVIYSCSIRLDPASDFSKLRYSVIVYFYPLSDRSGYAGRAIAVNIVK